MGIGPCSRWHFVRAAGLFSHIDETRFIRLISEGSSAAIVNLACSPGISGLWQVSGRNDASYEQRVLLDECYGREWTFVLDAQILLRTLPVVFKAKGSY